MTSAARKMAENDINIDAIGGGEGFARGGSVGYISLHVTPDDNLTDDDIKALLVDLELAGNRRPSRVEVFECLDIELDDSPGELAALADLLGDAGINIMSLRLDRRACDVGDRRDGVRGRPGRRRPSAYRGAA